MGRGKSDVTQHGLALHLFLVHKKNIGGNFVFNFQKYEGAAFMILPTYSKSSTVIFSNPLALRMAYLIICLLFLCTYSFILIRGHESSSLTGID